MHFLAIGVEWFKNIERAEQGSNHQEYGILAEMTAGAHATNNMRR